MNQSKMGEFTMYILMDQKALSKSSLTISEAKGPRIGYFSLLDTNNEELISKIVKI